ncbi:cytochrome P450 [Mycena rebaudengoi]|nr:cytochrome P450 [Mycena rebaudengoi]
MFQLVVLALVAYSIWRVQLYLKDSPLNNLDGPKPSSFLTGNLSDFHNPDGWDFHQDLEQNYGQVVKIRGLLGALQLYVFDPVALHAVLIEAADIYEVDETFMNVFGLIWGKGILSMIGEDHYRYRKILKPAFSTTNIREMLPTFYDVAEKVRDGLISPELKKGERTVDLNSILSRTSLEIVGRSGIGYSFDPMDAGEDCENKYAEALKDIIPTLFKLALLFPIVSWALPIFSPSFRGAIIGIIPSKTLGRAQDLIRTMHETASNLVHEKKAAIRQGSMDVNNESKDIMSHLLRGHFNAVPGLSLTEDELITQTGMMISAATDTTSSALDRIFHILASNQDIQDKLRAELLDAPENMTYEQIGPDFLPYMDSVVQEVLRLYPPVAPVTFRKTVADSALPCTPFTGLDGTRISSIAVPKGTTIYIAIGAANRNKHVWGDDALEFKPERWSRLADGASEKLCGLFGTMTFLGGSRACMQVHGFQFALLEIKVIMSVLLRAFKFSAGDDLIKWRMAGIIPVPTVNGEVKLPLMVQHVE